MSTISAVASPGVAVADVSPSWIQSRNFDLVVFVLSPLLGVAVALAWPAWPIIAAIATTVIGFPHYYSTFTFFFWRENRPHHLERWTAFFLGPVIIALVTFVLFAARIPVVIPFVVYFWNAYHVSLQSCGLLSIYRHRVVRPSVRDKRIANTAIVATNLWFALWNTEWYPMLHRVLTMPHRDLPRYLWVALGVVSIASCMALAWTLVERKRRGEGPSAAELAFLATSLLLFHPYLWVREPGIATLAMLMGHFVQYLGIVWLIHYRRFREAPDDRAERVLHTISSNPLVLATVLLTSGVTTFVIYLLFEAVSFPGAFEGLYMALAFTHFYLDGLFWAFRRPHVRRTLGPYLTWQPSSR
ncbi:MAG TPA: hypothetical protein VNL91_08955 [Thermoanaerobaculia bacterium]|nr:hypothetical protein [Thermoanaerobaculia bacterium]